MSNMYGGGEQISATNPNTFNGEVISGENPDEVTPDTGTGPTPGKSSQTERAYLERRVAETRAEVESARRARLARKADVALSDEDHAEILRRRDALAGTGGAAAATSRLSAGYSTSAREARDRLAE